MVNLTISPKQKEILKVLEDDIHTEVFGGGSAGGCAAGSTLIKTINGDKEISDLSVDDNVLTFNKKLGILEYNKIEETFINGRSVGCIRVTFKDGKHIKFTEDHKFLFNGEWIKLGRFIWRNLEKDRQKWYLLDKQQRKIKNDELEKFWENCDNETCYKQKGILAHGYSFRRYKETCSSSQTCSTEISTQGIRSSQSSESQKFKQKRQPSGEFGMGNSKRELSSCKEVRTDGQLYEECRDNIKSPIEKGLGQWNEQINRINSKRNKNQVCSKDIHEKDVIEGIQCNRSVHKRCFKQKELEACEIDFNSIIKLDFYWQDQPMYDIQTKNSSYVLVSGIIVHNSKSFTGCLWQVLRRLKYPGTRGFIARARLKSLKESTLLTFFEVCRMIGLKLNEQYKYNAQSNYIKFFNGSEVYLRDLFLYPSDPEFVSLGSTEYTDGFIDEMGDIGEQAYNIIKSRIRYKLDEFKLIPKVFMASNPCKTFVYREFYKKWRDKALEPYKAYVPASVYDNPFISEHYITNLKKLDKVNKARLLEGDWEYDDDPLKLFEYDKILDIFTNKATLGRRYASVDVAGRGRDKTIIVIWDGLQIVKIYERDNIKSNELIEILNKHQVPRSNCIIDEDGVGFGLKNDTSGTKGFVNNASAIKSKRETKIKEQNYQHLKSQCWFTLSHFVNNGLIGCYESISEHMKNLIIEDLEQMKQVDADKDCPLRVITKEELRENIGRSTDYGDAIMMRMYFELKPKVITV